MLHDKVVFRRESLVVECLARVTVAMEKVAVEPDAKVAAAEDDANDRRAEGGREEQKRRRRRGGSDKRTELDQSMPDKWRCARDCEGAPVCTYSPAPMAKLSALPLMKYKFSPVQG